MQLFWKTQEIKEIYCTLKVLSCFAVILQELTKNTKKERNKLNYTLINLSSSLSIRPHKQVSVATWLLPVRSTVH